MVLFNKEKLNLALNLIKQGKEEHLKQAQKILDEHAKWMEETESREEEYIQSLLMNASEYVDYLKNAKSLIDASDPEKFNPILAQKLIKTVQDEYIPKMNTVISELEKIMKRQQKKID
jgi:hypothetical protein